MLLCIMDDLAYSCQAARGSNHGEPKSNSSTTKKIEEREGGRSQQYLMCTRFRNRKEWC